jgi:hypothetical protein
MKKGAMRKGPVTLKIATEYIRLGILDQRHREGKRNPRWIRSLEIAYAVMKSLIAQGKTFKPFGVK